MTREPEYIVETEEIEDAPEDAEVVDGLPVLASEESSREIEPERSFGSGLMSQPKQVAALAATAFVAGAGTVALAHRRKAAKVTARRRKPGFGEIVTSNSFLVDVHLLRKD